MKKIGTILRNVLVTLLTGLTVIVVYPFYAVYLFFRSLCSISEFTVFFYNVVDLAMYTTTKLNLLDAYKKLQKENEELKKECTRLETLNI